MSVSSIGEVDLHAYVDGQLDAGRRADVEAYLAANPEAALHVQQLREQNQALHAAFDSVLNEPIPVRLTSMREPLRPRYHALAAGMAWLICGLVAGWFAHAAMETPVSSSPGMAFAEKAMVAHALYTKEKMHPVEVSAAQEAHLVSWLSKRLDATIHAPDLLAEDFSLLGGRLLPDNAGPLAQLMYQSEQGERLTLTVRRGARQPVGTGFQVLEQQDMSVFYWVDGDYGYALSGSIGKARMLTIAQAVDAQLRRK